MGEEWLVEEEVVVEVVVMEWREGLRRGMGAVVEELRWCCWFGFGCGLVDDVSGESGGSVCAGEVLPSPR